MSASLLQRLDRFTLLLIGGGCLFKKGMHVKHMTKTTLLALGSVLLAGLAGVTPDFRSLVAQQVAAPAAKHHVLTLEVAADCRTFVNGANRADASYGSGKIFPAGTLPSGAAANDPTQPVNGIAPIGDWTTRGQIAFPFPPEVDTSYSSTPTFFANQYYLLGDGRTALTVDGYAYFEGETPVRSGFSVTGGIGGFRGAAGDVQGTTLGTNVTGCPNFRATFNLVPSSVRGASGS
jgi:hypothetical protein